MDLILLDLNLPKITGHSLMNILKESGTYRNTPLIVRSGSSSPDDVAKAKDSGMVWYLVKPMTVEEMEQLAATLKEIFLGERLC